jgi:tartrate-resistant acid phosphatase type 5
MNRLCEKMTRSVRLLLLGGVVLSALVWTFHDAAEIRSHARAIRETYAVRAPSPPIDLVLFGDWGYGKWSSHERSVARSIARYCKANGFLFDAALLLGDNFYSDLPGGTADAHWNDEFQELFLGKPFAIPFYAMLGNHDYGKGKQTAELNYTKRDPTRRWNMPAKWYAVDLPAEDPFVTLIVLDSNIGRLSEAERAAQDAWLDGALAQRQNRLWLLVAAHHPLFSNGHGGDSSPLASRWGSIFKRYGVDFYVCGHDHGLQHLQLENWPITFLVSGAGGAKLQRMRRDDRGPFSRSAHGFLHIQLTDDEAACRFVEVNGHVAHVRSGGRDEPDLEGTDEND